MSERIGGALALATALNVGIVVVEVVYGLLAGSTALIADATHNAGDVIGLALAWGALMLARRQPHGRFTYGLRSGTITASLLNGTLLMAATGAIALEAVGRFFRPVPVAGGTVMIVAAAAFVLNAFSAWLIRRGHEHDLNVKGAYWHLIADAAVSIGVVVAGLLTLWTGATWLDPIASLVIAVVIAWTTWSLLREALNLTFHAAPASVNPQAVRTYLLAVPGIVKIHDLHVWAISTTETALTCHCLANGDFDRSAVTRIEEDLKEKFSISHSTIQVEAAGDAPCCLEPDEAI